MGEKDIDEEERQFLLTLGLVNQELRKRKFTQDSILCDNDHGVLVSFEGITLNYNLPAFDQNKEQYLQEQEEKHDKYLRKIQNHRLGIKNDLARLTEKDSLLAAKISKDDIQEKIKETAVKIAFDILYKQSAMLGKYFFTFVLWLIYILLLSI